MKTKTSRSLTPDKKSTVQGIKRFHYQVCYSSRADETIIGNILLQGNGLIVNNENEEVRPLWFTGKFLISVLYSHGSQQI